MPTLIRNFSLLAGIILAAATVGCSNISEQPLPQTSETNTTGAQAASQAPVPTGPERLPKSSGLVGVEPLALQEFHPADAETEGWT